MPHHPMGGEGRARYNVVYNVIGGIPYSSLLLSFHSVTSGVDIDEIDLYKPVPANPLLHTNEKLCLVSWRRYDYNTIYNITTDLLNFAPINLLIQSNNI